MLNLHACIQRIMVAVCALFLGAASVPANAASARPVTSTTVAGDWSQRDLPPLGVAPVGDPMAPLATTTFQSGGYRSLHLEEFVVDGALPFHVTADGDTLFVSDVSAGTVRVYQINASGVQFQRTIGSPGSGAGQFDGPEQSAVVGNDIYVTDFSNNRVQRFNKTTGAYVSQFGSTGTGDGQFQLPAGLVYNPANGSLYVSEVSNDRIQQFKLDGTHLATFSGIGAGNGQLNSPYALAADRRGNIYAADSTNNRIVKFDAGGVFIRNIAVGVNNPLGVAIDAADHLWITSSGSNDIYCYDTRGGYLAYYYGTSPGSGPLAGYFVALRGIAATAVLNVPPFNGRPALVAIDLGNSGGSIHTFTLSDQPTAHPSAGALPALGSFNGQVAFDSQENVYVTSLVANAVYKFDKFGNPITQWGSSGSGNGQFSGAYGITVDDGGNVFVADTGNNRIQKFDGNGNYLLKWGTAGSGNGQFSNPALLASDGTFLYVTDESNQRVQKFSASGTYVRQWGTGGSGNGQFQNPVGLAVDRHRGMVYVAEYFGNRIQQFSLFGDFVSVFSQSTSGTGTLASPRGLATDQAGNVYVSDGGNGRVVQFNDNGTYLSFFTQADPNGLGVNPANGQIYVGSVASGAVSRLGSVSGVYDTIGVYRPTSQTFLVRSSNNAGSSNILATVAGAAPTDLPVTGDWNGDGIDTAGLYRPSTNTFYLWDRWDDLALSSADYSFVFGVAGDLPLTGDWNADGRDGVGVYRPSTGAHLLRSTLLAGAADYTVQFGVAGDRAVPGDWNGDGAFSAGVYRNSDARFHVADANVNGAVAESGSYALGLAGDLPLRGDWTHSGYSGLGVFRPANSTFYLKNNLDALPADTTFRYRPTANDSLYSDGFDISADLPLSGNWGTPPE